MNNIPTLSDAQNAQLEHAIKVCYQDDEAEGKALELEAAVAIRDENGAAQDGAGACKKSKKMWSRQAHRTRSTSKCDHNLLHVRRIEIRAMSW